jgi:hypothetical protein
MYKVVFDVATSGYREWMPLGIGLIFIGFSYALLVVSKSNPEKVPGCFAKFFLGFSVLCTALGFYGTLFEYMYLVHLERTHQYQVVEGTVTNFVPMPYNGKGTVEVFEVRNVRFEYSDYRSTAAFNHSRSHGGPIREGLQVRIWYVDRSDGGHDIIRLEIKKSPTSIDSHGSPKLRVLTGKQVNSIR